MLTPADFIAHCKAHLAAGHEPRGLETLLSQALASQGAQPSLWAGEALMYRADDLLVVNLTLPPFAASAVHDHGTWALIGISSGCEIEHFHALQGTRVVNTDDLELRAGQTVFLAPDTIHAISNPLPTPSRGLHIYGTDLVTARRRMWDPASGELMDFDFALFERWEEQLTAGNRARLEGRGR